MSTHAAPTTYVGLRYWPFVGIWPLVAAVLFALPLALWLRHDAAPASVTCTAAFLLGAEPSSKRVDATCVADDPSLLRSTVPLPCGASAAALEGLLDRSNPFDRPLVHANLGTLSAAAPFDGYADGHPSSLLDADGARRVLLACADARPTSTGSRVVTILVTGRDYETSARVVALAFLLTLLLALRGSVTVRLDVAERLLTVVERTFFWERRTALCSIDHVSDVQVVTGGYGFLVGRRVEIVRKGGERIPLMETYAPLTFRVHAQAARRLRAYLEGLATPGRA